MSSVLLEVLPGLVAVVVVLFAVAFIYSAALGVMIWRLAVSLGRGFQEQRKVMPRASNGSALQK